MKHVSVVVPNGACVLSSVIGPYKILNAVNTFMLNSGLSKTPIFKVELVGLTNETVLYDGAFSIKPHKLISEVDKTDIIIITTILGDLEKELENNAPFIPWIQKHRIEKESEVASLCNGAFLLAETGLLNGKSATTHWIGAENFKMMYPQINLVSEKVIIEDNGIYTSGGAYSFLNLILHLVEKYAGKEAAIWSSKMFEIDFNRENQHQFSIFNGQKEHGDTEVKNAQSFIEQNANEKISVEDLANMFAISTRNFVRRFKKATTNTPIEYIQRVKIEVAKKKLESSTKNISEVMFDVGYNDSKAFRNMFRKHTGLSPIEYRNKYNRELALI